MHIYDLNQALIADSWVRKYEKRTRGWRGLLWFLPFIIFPLFCSMFLHQPATPEEKWIVIPYLLYFLFCFRYVFKHMKTENALCTYLAEHPVPYRVVQQAMTMEPDYRTAKLWAIECYECHTQGDCPLCGAN